MDQISSATITSATNNIGMMDMVTMLIQNGVPIAWIEHMYPYGLNYLNTHYTNLPLCRPLFSEVDALRLEHLQQYGKPRKIAQWLELWSPMLEDFDCIHMLMHIDCSQSSNQERGGHWLLYTELSTFLYLKDCLHPCFASPAAGDSGTSHDNGGTGSNNPTMDIEDPTTSTEPQVQLPPTSMAQGGGSNNPSLTTDSMVGDNVSNDPSVIAANATMGGLTMEVDDRFTPYRPLTPQPLAHLSLPPHLPSA
ncbi:hypothetical protein BDQ17DRAFT_1433822 [Cyathus striatus]|nr:hypothetical protein BDQ17DRAFT_1433822 [Cyathus striatus]